MRTHKFTLFIHTNLKKKGSNMVVISKQNNIQNKSKYMPGFQSFSTQNTIKILIQNIHFVKYTNSNNSC